MIKVRYFNHGHSVAISAKIGKSMAKVFLFGIFSFSAIEKLSFVIV